MDIATPHHTSFEGFDEWFRTLSRDPLRYMRISCLIVVVVGAAIVVVVVVGMTLPLPVHWLAGRQRELPLL